MDSELIRQKMMHELKELTATDASCMMVFACSAWASNKILKTATSLMAPGLVLGSSFDANFETNDESHQNLT